MDSHQKPEIGKLVELSGKRISPVSRQGELLELSSKYLVEADGYFFPGHQRFVKNNFARTVDSIVSNLTKIKPLNLDIYNSEALLESDLKTIIGFAKYEGVTEENLKKILEGIIAERTVRMAQLKNLGISLTDDPNFSFQDRSTQLDSIMTEIDGNGFTTVDNFYKKYPSYFNKIDMAHTIDELQDILHKAQGEFGFSKDDVAIFNKIKNDVKSKSDILKREASSEAAATKEERVKEFVEAFESGLEYLRFCYPESEIGRLAGVAETLIRQMRKARDSLEFTKIFLSSRKLAELFWPIRLGRTIYGLEKLGLSKEEVKKYIDKIFDRKLRTEAAGYWFEKSSKDLPRYQIHPQLALVDTIKSTLEAHRQYFSKSDDPVKFMILVNDNTVLKLDIPPEATIQDISILLKKTKVTKYDIESKKQFFEKRFLLKKDAYNAGKRGKEYRDFYSHKEPATLKIFDKRFTLPFETEVDGDYIVRLTTQTKNPTADKNSPFSLFAVDSHKALIDVDLNSEKGVELAAKFAHRYSDGKSSKPFFRYIFESLERQHQVEADLTVPGLDFLTQENIRPIVRSDDIFPSLPIFESDSSVEIATPVSKFVFDRVDGRPVISPAVLRAATIALANGVYDMNVLVAAKVNPQTVGPYDNVQPVIVSLYPIKDTYEKFRKNPNVKLSQKEINRVITWVKKTQEAENYAKKGLSTAAVLAAPTGRAENFIAMLSEPLHKGVRLLKKSSGMFSPLPELIAGKKLEGIVFYTAKGDTYDIDVNLNNPRLNSIGVIGYSQSSVLIGESEKKDQIFYAVRKSPSQAQASFRDFVINRLIRGKNKEEMIKRTNKILGDLIVDWGKFIIGDESIEKYQKNLKSAYNKLLNDANCGETNLLLQNINSPDTLQRKLNEILKEDAANTLNKQKITLESDFLNDFLLAVNNQIGLL